MTSLIDIAKEGLARDGRKLLISGCNINDKDIEGRTALMYAAWNGRYEFTKMLLECGAEIGINDNYGYSAIELAELESHEHIIELLSDYQNSLCDQQKLDSCIYKDDFHETIKF